MTLRYEDLPEADDKHLRARLQASPSRRGLLKAAAYGGMGLAFGAFSLVNRSAQPAEAAYFKDYTDTKSGPCATYARNHTERGLKCGPSAMCSDLRCCWRYRTAAGNLRGWHKQAPAVSGTHYLFRPDACWGGTYDSWQWKFSDGRTYRCSDGWTCRNGSCLRTICPWAV